MWEAQVRSSTAGLVKVFAAPILTTEEELLGVRWRSGASCFMINSDIMD